MEYLCRSEAETEALGARLAAVLSPGDVVAYRGGLVSAQDLQPVYLRPAQAQRLKL